MHIEKYNSAKKYEWNDFVKKSKNATFLFFRDYMDYHSDRYEDHSLMIYDDEKLIALFPANRKDDLLVSHGYLTYGGLLVDYQMRTAVMLRLFDELKSYCNLIDVHRIIYKTIPYIYHSKPSEEDLYSLFRNNAKLNKREVSSCIYLPDFKVPLNRKNGFNKATKNNLVLKESDDFEAFIQIANKTLEAKYGTSAVHTSAELKMLHEKFPENIKFFGAYIENDLLGGAIIFQNKSVAHAQYLHTSEEGKKYRTLDFIIVTLLTGYYKNYTYFDFGHSTENGGQYLNEALINLKEEYGGAAVCYDSYNIEL